MRALHNRGLKIFGPDREEAVGVHRKLHNLELMFCAAHVACRVLVFKIEGKKAYERPLHRWEYNTTIDLKQI